MFKKDAVALQPEGEQLRLFEILSAELVRPLEDISVPIRCNRLRFDASRASRPATRIAKLPTANIVSFDIRQAIPFHHHAGVSLIKLVSHHVISEIRLLRFL